MPIPLATSLMQLAVPGLVQPGNIDLSNRPAVKNADGTVSTVRSIGVGFNGREVLIPTVVNGRVVSNTQAIRHFLSTGEHLGIFETPSDADAFAARLHQAEATRLGMDQ